MKNLFLVLPLLALTSCATITRGVHDKLSVISDPAGADVKLSTGEHGVTPAKFVKRRKGESFTVIVSKSGYASQTINVESKGGALSPNPVSVHLIPAAKSKASKKTTPAAAAEKPSSKPTTTKTPAAESKPSPTSTPEATPPETTPPPINESTPEPTATPYVPPSLEASPTP